MLKSGYALWWTECGKCNKQRYEVIALSNLQRPEINKIFMDKFNVSLFPSRCEDCRNKEGE
jgi:hypothetical protein